VKFILPLLLINFFATPWELVSYMTKKTSIDLKVVTAEGLLQEEKLVFSYSRSKDSLTVKKSDREDVHSGDSIELWMRLFFMPQFKTHQLKVDSLMKKLQESGVDTEKKMISTTGPLGEVIYIIGRENQSDSGPFLAIYKKNSLPFKLKIDDYEATFDKYHKSVLPLAFPGSIKITRGEDTPVIYNFFRGEFKKQ
jgi:hypothetical protein